MKPVKLEILTETKGDGFKEALSGIKDMQSAVKVQKEYISILKADLRSLKGEFSRSTNADAMKPMAATISELEKELHDAEIALKLLDMSLEDAGDGSISLRTQIRNLENDMAKMTEGTEEYAAAMKRLGELRDRRGDITQQGSVLADDEKNIRATADAIAGLSGAMSAGVGIASLFGASQEKLQEIQTRLQAVMAITIGLQQVAQTLNKDSYFSIVILQGAKKKWAAAQAILNTQLGIGVGLSKALMFSGIGLLIAGITALVVVYDKWKKKQEEVNRSAKEMEEIRKEGYKSATAEVEKIQQLERVASDLQRPTKERLKALKTLNSLMPEYNGHLDRETGKLIANKGAMLEYIQALANMEVSKNLAMKNAEDTLKNIELEQKKKDYQDKKIEAPKKYTAVGTMVGGSITGGGYTNIVTDAQKAVAAEKNIAEAISTTDEEIAKNNKTIAERNKMIEELNKKPIKTLSDLENTSSGKSTTDQKAPDNKLAEQRLSAMRKIKEMEISMMEEGEAKRKAQAEQEYKNKLAEIAREKSEREKHVKELLKAKLPVSKEEVTAISEQEEKQKLLAKNVYNKQVQAIEKETAKQTKAIEEEIRLNFETRLNQQLADIDAYYHDLKKKANGNADLIVKIESARNNARQNVRNSFALEELDFEEQIALKEAEIKRKGLRLQADAEEESLKIQLKAAKRKLEKLQALQANGADVANDVKLVKIEIDKLNKSLGEMPTKKLQEAAGYFKNILGSLSEFGGDFGESMSAISGQVDNILASFKEYDSKEEAMSAKVSAGIAGLAELYNIAARQLEENKQKQAEWNDVIEETEHRARLARIELNAYSQANIFGVENPYARAISGAKEYAASMKELHGMIAKMNAGSVQTGTKKVVSGKNVAGGAAAGAAVGAAVGSFIPVIGNAVGALLGAIGGAIFGATRKKIVPVFESLTKTFGSVIKEGSETFELNPKILENYAKLDASTKKIVDNWEEIRKKTLEAEKQMEENFRDLAGDFGSSLSKSLADAFRNGDVFSAVDEFGDKVSDTIGKITEQLVFASIFQPLLDEMQEGFKKSFKAGGDGDIRDDILKFSAQYKDKLDDYNAAMLDAKEAMKSQGIDIFSKTKDVGRNAVQKGVAQASQDSIDEVNGRLTNMQGSLLTISEKTVRIVDLVFAIFAPINRIADNTDRLEAIEKTGLKAVEALEKMERDGINIKR